MWPRPSPKTVSSTQMAPYGIKELAPREVTYLTRVVPVNWPQRSTTRLGQQPPMVKQSHALAKPPSKHHLRCPACHTALSRLSCPQPHLRRRCHSSGAARSLLAMRLRPGPHSRRAFNQRMRSHRHTTHDEKHNLSMPIGICRHHRRAPKTIAAHGIPFSVPVSGHNRLPTAP